MTAPEEQDRPLLEEHKEEIKLIPIVHFWAGCYKLMLHTSFKIGSEEWNRQRWVGVTFKVLSRVLLPSY